MYIFFRLEKPVQCLKLHKVKPSVIFGFGGEKITSPFWQEKFEQGFRCTRRF
jgi:hypothetical protein